MPNQLSRPHLLPMTLIICNKMIYFPFRTSSANACAKDERNYNFILITMSALFIGCQWLKIVPDFYELFACKMTGHHCKMDGPVSKWKNNNRTRAIHCHSYYTNIIFLASVLLPTKYILAWNSRGAATIKERRLVE